MDGRFTASGHENGGIYIFNNETGRLFLSLSGKSSAPEDIDLFLSPARSRQACSSRKIFARRYATRGCWRLEADRFV